MGRQGNVNFLRRLPTARLLALCAMAVLVIAAGAAIASAALGGGASPPPKRPLAGAVRNAITAPRVPGISARVAFTNKLVGGSGLPTSSPLLSGAKGRLWLSPGRGFRLELQSDRGDAQLVLDGRNFLLYDGTNNTAYRGTLPQRRERKAAGGHRASAPTLAQVQQGIGRLAAHVLIDGPTPGTIAGRPAYTVRLSPRRHGGLLGGLELGWDAVRGVPLRLAIFARGNSSPVLELSATDVSYGSVPASTFAITPPRGAHVTDITPHPGNSAPATKPGFKVSAPATLAGLPRDHVQTIGSGADTGALVTYGTGLDGLLVIERPAATHAGTGSTGALGNLPHLSVNGADGSELVTALGTAVTFERGGVSYTVLGSVPKGTAEAAARGL